MVKKSELSEVVKNEMVAKYNSGISVESISELYNVPQQTVHYQITKYKKHHTTKNKARYGIVRLFLRQYKINQLSNYTNINISDSSATTKRR